jgi:CYTH domain-containing protein
MEIPKKFELGRNTWRVHTDRRGFVTGVYGMCYPSYQTVRVRIRTPKKMAESFWHEVTHAVLFDMKDPRWDDEKFVTAFSKRLTQVIHTAEF